MPLLQLRNHAVPIVEGRYPNTWQILGTSIFLHKSICSHIPGTVDPYALQVPRGDELQAFLYDWFWDQAYWYRGINGCAKAWDDLRAGKALQGPGDDPEPKYSMLPGDRSRKSAWLPGDLNYDISHAVSMLQNMSDVPLETPVPTATVIKVRLGKTCNTQPFCLMPGSEAALLGPIEADKYEVYNLTWAADRTSPEATETSIAVTTTMCAAKFLPPRRPFNERSALQVVKDDETPTESTATPVDEDSWNTIISKWLDDVKTWQENFFQSNEDARQTITQMKVKYPKDHKRIDLSVERLKVRETKVKYQLNRLDELNNQYKAIKKSSVSFGGFFGSPKENIKELKKNFMETVQTLIQDGLLSILTDWGVGRCNYLDITESLAAKYNAANAIDLIDRIKGFDIVTDESVGRNLAQELTTIRAEKCQQLEPSTPSPQKAS